MCKKIITLYICLISYLNISAQNTLIRSRDDEYFRTGLELLDQKKYAEARTFFEKFVSLNKETNKTIDAEYYIAFSALNLFNPDAETLFQSFISKYPYHSKAATANYDLGTFYYNNKKYDKAIEYLEKVNMSQLSSAQMVEAKFRLGYSYFSQKEFDKAAKYFNEIKNSNHKYTYAASYYAAYIEYRNDEYEAALKDLKEAEKSDAYKAMVPMMVVNVYYKKGAYDDLLSYAEETLKKNEKLVGVEEMYLLMAEAYFKKEDYKNAIQYFNKYASESRGRLSAEVQFRLAIAEYKTENYKEAANNFKAIAANKDSIGQAASYYLGASYVRLDNKPYALTAFDQSRKGNFNKEIQEEAWFNYAKLNYDLEKFSDAIASLKEFTKKFPNSSHNNEVNELISESFLRTNNYSEAISYIEGLRSKSIRVNTAYQRVTLHKGIELFNNIKYEEAIEMFNKSLENEFDKEAVLAANFFKGEAFSVLKNYDNAINSYAVVFQKSSPGESPFFLKSRYGIGYAYYNTQQYDKALPHFREYVNQVKDESSKPNYEDALLRLADLYYVTKKYDEAIRHYDKAIDLKGADEDYAYFQKGVVYGLTNKLEQAISNFDIVIKKYPNSLYYDDALFQRSEFELENSNYIAAIDGFTSIITKFPSSGFVPYALLKRAISYKNLQRNNEAVQDYKKIMDQYATHEVANSALLGLQESLAAAGRAEELDKFLSKYKEANPKSDALVSIEFENAKSLYSDQKYKQAVESFNKYISNYPESPNINDAHYYLAESYFRLKDYNAAIPEYKLVMENKASPFNTRAIQRTAEIQYLQGNFQSAKEHFLSLLQNARNKKERFNAWTGLVESYFKLSSFDSSAFYANEILNHGNASIDAENKALLYLGKISYKNGDQDKALDYFLNALNSAKDENGAEAAYFIAEIQHKQGKYKQSLETLYNLNNTFPSYDHWLGRSFLLIAENFIAMKEHFQAKATLNSIIEKSPHKESVEKAKIRLAELEGKENTPVNTPADSVK